MHRLAHYSYARGPHTSLRDVTVAALSSNLPRAPPHTENSNLVRPGDLGGAPFRNLWGRTLWCWCFSSCRFKYLYLVFFPQQMVPSVGEIIISTSII